MSEELTLPKVLQAKGWRCGVDGEYWIVRDEAGRRIDMGFTADHAWQRVGDYLHNSNPLTRIDAALALIAKEPTLCDRFELRYTAQGWQAIISGQGEYPMLDSFIFTDRDPARAVTTCWYQWVQAGRP